MYHCLVLLASLLLIDYVLYFKLQLNLLMVTDVSYTLVVISIKIQILTTTVMNAERGVIL